MLVYVRDTCFIQHIIFLPHVFLYFTTLPLILPQVITNSLHVFTIDYCTPARTLYDFYFFRFGDCAIIPCIIFFLIKGWEIIEQFV